MHVWLDSHNYKALRGKSFSQLIELSSRSEELSKGALTLTPFYVATIELQSGSNKIGNRRKQSINQLVSEHESECLH
jgi:hypothetical protein